MRGAAWSTTRSTYGVPLAARSWPTSPAGARNLTTSQARAYDSADSTTDHRDDLVRRLSRLPEQQRKIVVLRYYADQSEASVAEALGISVGTVKSAASRGLATLRQHAKAEAPAPGPAPGPAPAPGTGATAGADTARHPLTEGSLR